MLSFPLSPPKTEQALLQRAKLLAGLNFAEVAEMLHIPIPQDLRRHKGWVGHLLEYALGADGGSQAERDFYALGIELKTIPINAQGKPLETTFVSLAPLTQTTGVVWETSHVCYKLAKVLWIPVEGERHIPLAERRIGYPILWQPTKRQTQQLHQDWEELMTYITLGQLNKINARIGEVLQLRPKGANSQSLTTGFNEKGEIIHTLPLGFYLRKNFTQEIINRFLASES